MIEVKLENIIQVADQKESEEAPIVVYTHNGRFHLDEVAAIALLRHFVGKVEVKRVKHDTSAEAISRNVQPGTLVFIVDIGHELNLPDWSKYYADSMKQSGGVPKPIICDHHKVNIADHSAEILLKYLTDNGLVQQIDVEALERFVTGVTERDRGLHKDGSLPNIADIISEMEFDEAVNAVYHWIFNLRLNRRGEILNMYSYVETDMVKRARKNGYDPDNVDFIFLPMLNDHDEWFLVPIIPTENACNYYAKEAINMHGHGPVFVLNSWKYSFSNEAIIMLEDMFEGQIKEKVVKVTALGTQHTVIINFLDHMYLGNSPVVVTGTYLFPIQKLYDRMWNHTPFIKVWENWLERQSHSTNFDFDTVEVGELLVMRGIFNDGSVQVRSETTKGKG